MLVMGLLKKLTLISYRYRISSLLVSSLVLSISFHFYVSLLFKYCHITVKRHRYFKKIYRLRMADEYLILRGNLSREHFLPCSLFLNCKGNEGCKQSSEKAIKMCTFIVNKLQNQNINLSFSSDLLWFSMTSVYRMTVGLMFFFLHSFPTLLHQCIGEIVYMKFLPNVSSFTLSY